MGREKVAEQMSVVVFISPFFFIVDPISKRAYPNKVLKSFFRRLVIQRNTFLAPSAD